MTAPKPDGIMRSTALVGVMTLLSRVAGLVREILMAATLGASLHKSAFDLAFRVPNLFRQLFGEGALSAAFVPVFTERMERESPEMAGRLGARMAGLLLVVLGGIAILGMAFTRQLQRWIPAGAPGSRMAAVDVMLPLMRIMLPYAPLICLAALAMGMLNARGRFGIPALAPVLLNLTWIGVLVLVFPRLPSDPFLQVRALAFGILLAGILQLGVQLPFLHRAGFRPRIDFRFRSHPDLGRVLRLMAPVTIGMGVVQINVMIDGALALFAATWAPAALEYAHRLVYLPLGIFATALGTVLLPTFSRQAAHRADDRLRNTLERALHNVLLIMTPIAAVLTVLALPTVTLVFQRGAFGPLDSLRTSRALVFYAPGLLLFSLHKALTPVYYALKDSRTPMRIGLFGVALNFVLNVTFVLSWPREFRHAGLAAATVFSSLFNVVCLLRLLRGKIPGLRVRRLGHAAARFLLAGIGAGAIAASVHARCARAAWMDGLFSQAVALALAGAAALIVYAILVYGLDRHAFARLRGARGFGA